MDNLVFNLHELVHEYLNIRNQGNEKRIKNNIELIDHRFGLCGKSRITLNALGVMQGAERQAIEQREKHILNDIRKWLSGNPKKKSTVLEVVSNQYKSLEKELEKKGVLLTEEEIISLVAASNQCQKEKICIGNVYLLLTLLGYKKVVQSTCTYSGNLLPSWYLASEIKESTVKYLLAIMDPKNIRTDKIFFAEIIAGYTKVKRIKNRESDINKDTVSAVVQIASDLEEEEGYIKVKFNALSLADKAYKLLASKPETRKTVKGISDELSSLGGESIPYRRLSAQLSNDDRFVSNGTLWGLIGWQCCSKGDYKTRVWDFIHVRNKEISSKEVIEALPDIPPASIRAYLGDKDRFFRTESDKYAMKDWKNRYKMKKNMVVSREPRKATIRDAVFQGVRRILKGHGQLTVSELYKLLNKSYPCKYETFHRYLREMKDVHGNKNAYKKVMYDLEKGEPTLEKKILIVTALPLETAAVLAHLPDWNQVSDKCDNVNYKLGLHNGWNVAVTQSGMGNHQASTTTQNAIRHFQPTYAFFVGIAGGRKDLRKLDVIAAQSVIGYEFGKEEAVKVEGETQQKFYPRPHEYQSSSWLCKMASNCAADGNWKALSYFQEDMLGGRTLNEAATAQGSLASGSVVVASNDGETAKRLHEYNSKTKAVEMEGLGFMHAAHEANLEAICIRGISDEMGDKSKGNNDVYQTPAAQNAAAFTFQMIGEL